MFERMIVATDLSPASHAVVSCLAGLRAFGAEQVLLLQCLTFADAASTALSYDIGPLEAQMEEQRAILERQGFTVEGRTVVGSPKQEIVRVAKEEGYSLIVVGAQGRSLMAERLLGGVAYGIVTRATMPVLVVPIETRAGDETICQSVTRCRFDQHILYATDFSDTAARAFTVLRRLIDGRVERITLVHVQDRERLEKHLAARLEEFNEIDRGRLEALKRELLDHGARRVDTEVCFGVPHQEITRLIRERDVQLAVLGSQGRGFVGELMLGSVSHSVVRNSVAPVLLVRE